MATKKFEELQGYSDADLITELAETEKRIGKLKFDHAIKGLENPLALREVRRDIARLKTEISRRAIVADPEAYAKRDRVLLRRKLNK